MKARDQASINLFAILGGRELAVGIHDFHIEESKRTLNILMVELSEEFSSFISIQYRGGRGQLLMAKPTYL